VKFQAQVLFAMAVALCAGAGAYLIGRWDPAGLVLLVTAAVFAGWGGWFLLREFRSLPEMDDPESGGPLGTFPDSTRWAPVLGLGAVILVNGVIAGTWLLMTGAALTVMAAIGYAFEYSVRQPAPGDSDD